MLTGNGRFWRACINATGDEKDVANLKMMGNKYPFVADAIIANPLSFAHFHCAEKLGGKSSPNRTFRDSIPVCNPILGIAGSEA